MLTRDVLWLKAHCLLDLTVNAVHPQCFVVEKETCPTFAVHTESGCFLPGLACPTPREDFLRDNKGHLQIKGRWRYGDGEPGTFTGMGLFCK